MKKEIKIRLVVINIALVFLVIGLGGYIIYDKVIATDSENNDNNNIEGNSTSPNEKNTITKTIDYNNEPIYFDKYYNEFQNNKDNKDKFLNVIINNIKLGEKNYTFKFMNRPYGGTAYEYKGYYNSFYIDDVMIYHQNDQAAYLEGIVFVAEINNEHIVTYFAGQGGNRVSIYDKNYNLVRVESVINAKVENDEIVFTNYEEGDHLYLLNTYKLEKTNGYFQKVMTEKGKESYCNEMTGVGYCK